MGIIQVWYISFVENIIENFEGHINCVNWSPNGDMLASASEDKTVKLLDVKNDKVIYTGKTADGSNYTLISYILIQYFRSCKLCDLLLSQKWCKLKEIYFLLLNEKTTSFPSFSLSFMSTFYPNVKLGKTEKSQKNDNRESNSMILKILKIV